MNRRVFEAALRATAKITFGTHLVSAGLVGCGASVNVQEGEDSGDDGAGGITPPGSIGEGDGSGDGAYVAVGNGGSGGAPDVAPPRPPPPRPEVNCAAPPGDPPEWHVYHAETFDCCASALEPIVPDDPRQAWWNEVPSDEITACCHQLITPNYPAVWSGGPLTHPLPDNVLAACCVVKHGNVACAPWGPPMPPSMSAEDLERWQRRSIEVPAAMGAVA